MDLDAGTPTGVVIVDLEFFPDGPSTKKRRRPKRLRQRPKPPLNIEQILEWARLHHERTGRWPTAWLGGRVVDAPHETWNGLQQAIRNGARGLPGGQSLAQLLAERFGYRNQATLPRLTIEQVLAWADAHHARTGRWPKCNSGSVLDAPGETWQAVERALQQGGRGLPRYGTLSQLLAEHRYARHHLRLPRFTVNQILAWADEHFRRTGRWPTFQSGPIFGTEGEMWWNVSNALRLGLRGLPGGSSLPELLETYRGVRRGRRKSAK